MARNPKSRRAIGSKAIQRRRSRFAKLRGRATVRMTTVEILAVTRGA